MCIPQRCGSHSCRIYKTCTISRYQYRLVAAACASCLRKLLAQAAAADAVRGCQATYALVPCAASTSSNLRVRRRTLIVFHFTLGILSWDSEQGTARPSVPGKRTAVAWACFAFQRFARNTAAILPIERQLLLRQLRQFRAPKQA